MGFHVKLAKGDGIGIRLPDGNIEFILDSVNSYDSGDFCNVRINGSSLVPEGSLERLSQDFNLQLAPNVKIKLEDFLPRARRVKFYIDKPSDYRTYKIPKS